MPTVSDYADRMRRALAITEPDLDTSVGTVVRKILDSVAEVRAEADVDRYILDYQYDIDSKTGADLDDFVGLFGFSRLPARRATGTLTFERNTAPLQSIIISAGTQVATTDRPPVVAQTLVPAVITTTDTSVSVPVQAVVGGAAGNVGAATLEMAVTPLQGILSFSNLQALTGGADAETDDQLRARWKRTAFRNLAGTEAMFLGLALDDVAVTQANVIGASKRHREQVQVIGGVATSVLTGVKHVYDGSSSFGTAIDEGSVLMEGVYYSFTSGPPAGVTVLDPTNVPDGIYDLEYEYLPQASRNDPDAGVTNRVDVYVDGRRPTEAFQTVIFRSNNSIFRDGADPTHPLVATKFERVIDGSVPQVNNHFTPFAFGPVTDPSLTNTIVVGAETYTENVDYWLVQDITENGGTSRSLSGIEWLSTANGQAQTMPTDGTPISINYIFNAVPGDIESVIRAWRLITTDVRVHQAKTLLMVVNLVVILSPGFTLAGVQTSVHAAVSRYLDSVTFEGAAQVSDVEAAVHAVSGVDAVRFATENDDPVGDNAYAWQRISVDTDGGVTPSVVLQTYAYSAGAGTPARATDIILAADQVLDLDHVNLYQRAQNTWSQGAS